MLNGLFGILLLGFWAFCLVDVAMAPPGRSRGLPKLGWLIVIILLNALGGVIWLVVGRPRRLPEPAHAAPAASNRPRVLGPEDAPDFEARIQRGLRRLAEGDDDHR